MRTRCFHSLLTRFVSLQDDEEENDIGSGDVKDSEPAKRDTDSERHDQPDARWTGFLGGLLLSKATESSGTISIRYNAILLNLGASVCCQLRCRGG